jgi:hypothetical protein
MLKIVIQNPSSETIINNVCPEELGFWRNLLDGAVRGEIKVFDVETGLEYREYQEAFHQDTYKEGYQVA